MRENYPKTKPKKQVEKLIDKINKTKNLFLVNINKIDKLSARLTRQEREKTPVTKSGNERRDITTNSTEYRVFKRNPMGRLGGSVG